MTKKSAITVANSVLTMKQKLFIAEYLVDHNGTRSAVAAGYSKKTSHVIASRLLKNKVVIAAIREAEKKTLERIEVTQDEVMRQLYYLLTRKASEFVDEENRIIPIHQMSERAQALIDGIESETFEDLETGERRTKTKIRVAGKTPGIDMALKMLGLYSAEKKDVNHTINWDALTCPKPPEKDPIERRLALEEQSPALEEQGDEDEGS